jgi:hypothetical protein
MITYQKTIAGLSGHPMSGLWELVFTDGYSCFIESGYGVRNLAVCFGASEGAGDLLEKIQGQEIVFSVDGLNLMCGFTPSDDWVGPEIPEEGIEEEEEDEQ